MGVRRFWEPAVQPRRRRDRRGALAAAAVCTTVAVGLSGCSAGGVTGPAAQGMAEETSGPIYLGLTDDPVQHRLAESYESAFAGTGRPVELRDIEGSDRLGLLRNGEVNVVLGCVGELLDVLDPVKGEELRGLYAQARDEGADPSQWRDIAHTTMFSALPTDLQASDPGEAVGCDDDSLPQNTVAVYRKTALERADRRALNNVAGGVSSDDLAADGDDD